MAPLRLTGRHPISSTTKSPGWVRGLEALIEASRGLRLLERVDQVGQGAVADLPVIRPTFLDAFRLPDVRYARYGP